MSESIKPRRFVDEFPEHTEALAELSRLRAELAQANFDNNDLRLRIEERHAINIQQSTDLHVAHEKIKAMQSTMRQFCEVLLGLDADPIDALQDENRKLKSVSALAPDHEWVSAAPPYDHPHCRWCHVPKDDNEAAWLGGKCDRRLDGMTAELSTVQAQLREAQQAQAVLVDQSVKAGDVFNALTARAEQAEASRQWQSMETAPKGTLFYAYYKGMDGLYVKPCRWSALHQTWWSDVGHTPALGWMPMPPLPAPPAALSPARKEQ